MHALDVLLDGLRRGFEANHRFKAADRGDVVVDGDLGQAVPRMQMPGEPDESGLDRVTGNHEASLTS
jgi:hypothetical protein